MSRIFSALLLRFLCLAFFLPNAVFANDAYLNGRWYDGQGFVERAVYVVDGHIKLTPPDFVANTYQLDGAYVVPPFGEAHNHDLTTDFEPQERIDEYLRDGVFYAKMQSAFSNGFERVAPHFNKPDSIDVIFAFAPVTGPGGHPISLREFLFERGVYEGIFDSKEDIAGIGYTEVANREELTQKWPELIRQEPDFIKFMLSYSEEYALRKNDPEFFGRKGIDPKLVPDLVSLAHEQGLSITAHVDTAVDFHYAVNAGVDEVAHLPGTVSLEVIREDDATAAAENGVSVVSTVSLTTKIKDELPAYYEKVMHQHARNLKRLKDAGVIVLVGSDMPYRDTSVGELFLLRELGVFTDAELLKMWSETTPRSIFPDRRIGRLDDGFEASFLVLAGNPIENLNHTRDILLRVKQGQRLSIADSMHTPAE